MFETFEFGINQFDIFVLIFDILASILLVLLLIILARFFTLIIVINHSNSYNYEITLMLSKPSSMHTQPISLFEYKLLFVH